MEPLYTLNQKRRLAGLTLPEIIVSSSVMALFLGGLLVCIIVVQKSFAAAQHHSQSQIQQTRIVDYVSLDLRRALTVNLDTYNGQPRLTLTIPGYYQRAADAPPRRAPGIFDNLDVAQDPRVVKGRVEYGASPMTVRYYMEGSSVFRSVDGQAMALATDVQDFNVSYTEDDPTNRQFIGITASFVPRFQWNQASREDHRIGTTIHASTLLRNARRN